MNKIYYGDNLEIMRKYIENESIDLCYIDPPFNSARDYNQIYTNADEKDKAQAQAFVDTWKWSEAAESGLRELRENARGLLNRETSRMIECLFDVFGRCGIMSYIISMTLRIVEIHRALKSSGSFYLHCDPTVSHYLKLILDCVFVFKGGDFENEISWKRYAVHSLSKKRFDAITDAIFFYSKSKNKNTFNTQFQQLPQEELQRRFPHIEENTGRRFQHAALEKSANRSNKKETRIIQGKETATNLGWIWSQETFDERISKNPYLIYWTETGRPRYKIYLDEYSGFPVGSCWYDIAYLSAGDKERLGYPTQKPEALLERIIKASSNEGDVVFDAFCGCGTTVAVAERLKRKWIGIDITYQSVSLIVKRLEDTYGKDILNKFELNGIPKDIKSAVALAHKKDDYVRKEFEKWAILTYSNNRAFINEKKGSDKGIDGIAYMAVSLNEQKKILFSVKSGKAGVKDIRDLRGTIDREKAGAGIFITTAEPTKDMITEALSCGKYNNPVANTEFDIIKIVTVQDIIDGERLSVPLSADIVKKAASTDKSEQTRISL